MVKPSSEGVLSPASPQNHSPEGGSGAASVPKRDLSSSPPPKRNTSPSGSGSQSPSKSPKRILPKGMLLAAYPYTENKDPVKAYMTCNAQAEKAFWMHISSNYFPDAISIDDTLGQKSISYVLSKEELGKLEGTSAIVLDSNSEFVELCFSSADRRISPQENANSWCSVADGRSQGYEGLDTIDWSESRVYASAAPSVSCPSAKGAEASSTVTPGTTAYWRKQEDIDIPTSQDEYRPIQHKGRKDFSVDDIKKFKMCSIKGQCESQERISILSRRIHVTYPGQERVVPMMEYRTTDARVVFSAAKPSLATKESEGLDDQRVSSVAEESPPVSPGPAPVLPQEDSNQTKTSSRKSSSCSILPFLILLTLLDALITGDQFSFKGGFHCREGHQLMAVVAGAVLVLLVATVVYLWNRPEASDAMANDPSKGGSLA